MDDSQSAALRYALVEALQQRGTITDSRVARAFATVPRHRFVPGIDPITAYSDRAIVTKEQAGVGLSSSSQPAMMAIMLQQLALEPGMRVLEIGAGTGYNAALLRYLTGPTGEVTTIDVDEDIVAAARSNLAATGYGDVRVLLGDGGYGWPDGAPYDRIILTVGADDLLPAWRTQLRPHGILVIPLQIGTGMYSIALHSLPGDRLLSASLSPCGFIRLRGAFASAEQTLAIDRWQVTIEPGARLDPARLPALLAQPRERATLPVDLNAAFFFLRFCGEPGGRFVERGKRAPDQPPPMHEGYFDTTAMSGYLFPAWDDVVTGAGQIFGSDTLYRRLVAYLAQWADLGGPRLDDLGVLIVPRSTAPLPPDLLTIDRPHATLILTDRSGHLLSLPSRQ